MIWNNGDGNDDNEGDAGVDETLITEGTADDENDRHAERRRLPLRSRTTAPFGVNIEQRREAVAHVVLGQRQAHDRSRASACR